MNQDVRTYFTLDPNVSFLNHGSFGSCPQVVQDVQTALRARMEREPVRFYVQELEGLLDETRALVAARIGATAEDVALLQNATAAVNAVLFSLPLRAGDELLCTDHGYNACTNVLQHTAERTGARVVIAAIPFPIASSDEVVERVLAQVTPRTRLALLDHVTSPTGLVFPIERLVAELAARGIDTLVDGAHAPGMLPLELNALGAAYYTGNLHKWCCAPKGAAFLHVRRDRQAEIHPAVISHGKNSPRRDRSRYLIEFDWIGTIDYTPLLAVPSALRFLDGLLPGGFPELLAQNRLKALAARRLLAAALEIPLPCPDEMIGALAALPLPDGDLAAPRSPFYPDSLQDALIARHAIQVPIIPWPRAPRRLIRISAQIYNRMEEYEKLGAALRRELFSAPVK